MLELDTTYTGEALPIRAAARFLGMSPTPLKKGLAAGVIPDLTLASVGAISLVEVLIEVTNDAGVTVPVLRLPSAETADRSTLPMRAYTGYAAHLSDKEFLDAAARWWKSGTDYPLQAGALMVACGGVVVGWLDILGVKERNSAHGIYFDARVVARLSNRPANNRAARGGDVVTGHARLLDPDSPNAMDAVAAVGKRVLGGGGGSITRLDSAIHASRTGDATVMGDDAREDNTE
ncbi:hypothetical protein EAO79_12030 [Plantibacter sp. PA-3-X8]|uniref:hypothetical protein n=1 Tax=unclassified Plantibacter TaxID=2624265 RepID=UPI000F5E79BA|nr:MULTISPECIES: hypothetical protein [unclassified Plantibacter]AZH83547.1 hypothetical protein EAO79_12030 [Plantibacter sp. PA-3-X8]